MEQWNRQSALLDQLRASRQAPQVDRDSPYFAHLRLRENGNGARHPARQSHAPAARRAHRRLAQCAHLAHLLPLPTRRRVRGGDCRPHHDRDSRGAPHGHHSRPDACSGSMRLRVSSPQTSTPRTAGGTRRWNRRGSPAAKAPHCARYQTARAATGASEPISKAAGAAPTSISPTSPGSSIRSSSR